MLPDLCISLSALLVSEQRCQIAQPPLPPVTQLPPPRLTCSSHLMGSGGEGAAPYSSFSPNACNLILPTSLSGPNFFFSQGFAKRPPSAE